MVAIEKLPYLLFKIMLNPWNNLKLIFFLLALYATYRAYKTYKKTKQRTSLFMFIIVSLFSLNLISQAFEIEQFIMIVKELKLNLFLSFLPIVVFLLSDYFQRKRFKAEVETKKVKELFKRYVNPYIADKLAENPESIADRVKQEVTMVFVDIRGFTSLSERLDAEHVVILLNKYFTSVTEAIFKYNGTVDKFIGDSVMAMFNAPLYQDDHADRAVKSGLEIIKSLEKLNESLKKENLRLDVGIGINTGVAIVGNIGTEQFLDYTAIGDTVNIASRLQGKAGKMEIMISDATLKKLKNKFNVKHVGSLELKGKTEKVKTYQVI